MLQRNQLLRLIRERLILLNPDITFRWLDCLSQEELQELWQALEKAVPSSTALICF